jgi:protein TonB
MTRSEKKCLAFSLGMHSLLALILIGSAAFESMPQQSNLPILNMIPARILDNAGVGGGSPTAEPPPPQPQPIAPAQAQSQPQPQPVAPPKPAPPELVKRVEPKPERVEAKPVERELPAPTPRAELPSPKPIRKAHEIQVDYTPNTAESSQRAKPKTDEAENASASAAATARAEARRDRAIQQALQSLESGLEVKASQRTVVDTKGDGGESFADYNTVVRSIYFKAWTTPDNVANKLAEAKVKLVVARDGTILSAEIVDPSGEAGVDKSVERVLRAVTRLPEFPAQSHDQQRTFIILFNVEAKEASG